jgi:DNA-binding XRE family transcriptional regulator
LDCWRNGPESNLGGKSTRNTGPERAFGKALREFRNAIDVSQEQFALDGGFDRTYISLLERGISSPTIRSLFKLPRCSRWRRRR